MKDKYIETNKLRKTWNSNKKYLKFKGKASRSLLSSSKDSEIEEDGGGESCCSSTTDEEKEVEEDKQIKGETLLCWWVDFNCKNWEEEELEWWLLTKKRDGEGDEHTNVFIFCSTHTPTHTHSTLLTPLLWSSGWGLRERKRIKVAF